MKQAIYVDMDDVITETTRQYAGVVQRMFGREVRYADIRNFDLQASFGLSGEEFTAFFARIHEEDFLEGLPPLPHVLETLEALRGLGFSIHVVTGRITGAHGVSIRWLQQNAIPVDRFVIVNKYARPDMDPKLCIPLEGLDTRPFAFAVEDSPATALFLAETRKVPVFLMDRPWNHHLVHPRITRIASWLELRASLALK